MNRLCRWLRRRGLSKVRIAQDKPSSQEAAQAALERSTRDLEQIQRRRPEVEELSKTFREELRRNHFSERLEYSYS